MELSLVAQFDDLKRCGDILTDGTSEIEYRRFLQIQEESRLEWQATTAEAQRLQRELDKCAKERTDLESKLFHARRLLEMESKARRSAELERDHLEKKLNKACDYLRTDRDIDEETRNKLAFLNMSTRKRRSRSNKFGDEKYCNEINSTGSFLDDLSLTQSEEDFLEMSKPFKKHRPSKGVNVSVTEIKPLRRNSRRKSIDPRAKKDIIDLDASDRIVATTKLSIPQGDGLIEATSTIEAQPNSCLYNKCEKPITSNRQYNETDNKENKLQNDPIIPNRQSMKLREEYPIPSAPPLQEINSTPKLLLNLQGRQHEFISKTVLRSENCVQCFKKFRFGSSSLKCRLCGAYVHSDCKLQYAKVCVAKNQSTPNIKNGKGLVVDFSPSNGPMVPPIIVHCVDEIETRGLSEEGIYRVSGSEKDIRELKERFLSDKSLPLLSKYDIHVICGCVKDFLRNSLREPLIPTNLWRNFSNAIQMVNDVAAVCELYAAINQLPQANRDTLAFIILHLQRVASCPATKMPRENLAKVFGPTILGYSSLNPDRHAIFTETLIQKDVIQHLLDIPSDYWTQFITITSSDTESEKTAGNSYFGTPMSRIGNTTMRKDRKYFATPPCKR